MATDVEKLIAQLEVRQREFEKGLERAVRTTQRKTGEINRRFAQTNKSATAQMAALGRGIFASLGPVLGAGTALTGGALIAGIRSSVSQLSALGKQARDTGLDVEELQGLMRGFARNTRVTEDQLATAFVAFNRRAGEALHGTGELATASKRYGFSVTDANGRLRSQSDLLREIARVMQGLPNQQERAALAMQAFGDVGRIMSSELGKGPEALERMITEAREAGDVLDRDLIQRAEILDDKFDTLTRRAGTFFKAIAVGAAGVSVETPLDILERVFGSIERARAELGEGLVESLTADLGVLDEYEGKLGNLERSLGGLTNQADTVGRSLETLRQQMKLLDEHMMLAGVAGSSNEIGAIQRELRGAVEALKDGEISAAEFGTIMQELQGRVTEVAGEVEGIDHSSLSQITGQFLYLVDLVQMLTRRTREFKAEAGAAPPLSSLQIRENAIAESGAARAQAQAFIAEQERQRSLTVEQISLEREMDSLRRDAGRAGVTLTEAQIAAQAKLNLTRQAELGAAGGSSAGSARGAAGRGQDDFTRAVEAIRERTLALEAEAVAIAAAAQGGQVYGDALDYARTRAQLMVAAQKSGLAVTPELEAAIDRLATSYDRAGQSAKDAADKMTEAEGRAKAGAQAMTNLFMGMMQGSDQAKQALAQLLLQIAQVQMVKGLQGAFPGAMSFLGGLLGFASGGYTGDGGKHQPKGVVHGGEYVFSKKAVQAAGVPQLESLHRRLQGFSQGGLVGAAGGRAMPASPAAAGSLAISVGFDSSLGAFRATVRDEQGRVVAQAIENYDRQALPRRVQQINADPRVRG